MARKSKQEINDAIIKEALQRYEDAKRFDYDERQAARNDIAFAQVEGEQWDKRFRQNKQRPKFEINKVQHAINQVVGEFVDNEIGTKVRAASSEATEAIANTLTGIIRNIYSLSNFRTIQKEVLKEVCNGGYGAWRVKTDFIDFESFDQDIYLEWVPDAVSSVWFDPFDKDPLKRNSRYCFVVEDLSRQAYRDKYPDSTLSSFDKTPEFQRLRRTDWLSDNSVRVAEYFRKVPRRKKIVLMSDGKSYFFNDVKEVLDEWEAERGISVVRERVVNHFDIEWSKINGCEVLEGPIIWPGQRYLPVIPVYGFHYWINGTFTYRGMVRFAKDAQRIYNYVTSAKIEAAANTPKDPIFITPSQVGEYEDDYKNFNLRNTPFLFWNPDDEQAPPPFRLGPPTLQQALIDQAQQASIDIQATTGRNEAALGNQQMMPGNVPSGDAIRRVQHASNVGQQELFGNLADAVEHTGNVLIDLIPRVYDHEMQIRILQPDGSTDFVTVNEETIDMQSGDVVLSNDLNLGKYDVKVTLGPTFQSQRQETMVLLQNLGQENPEILRVTADLLVKALDHPLSDEIEARIRKQMLKQGLVEPNETEAQEIAQAQANQPPDPIQEMQVEALKLQLQQQAAQVDYLEAQILKEQAAVQKTLSDAEYTEVRSATQLMDSITKQVEAGMAANIQAIQALQIQLQQAQQSFTSDLPDQLNEAFKRLAPGLYQDNDGNVMEVDDEGQVRPVMPQNAELGAPEMMSPSIPQGGL